MSQFKYLLILSAFTGIVHAKPTSFYNIANDANVWSGTDSGGTPLGSPPSPLAGYTYVATAGAQNALTITGAANANLASNNDGGTTFTSVEGAVVVDGESLLVLSNIGGELLTNSIAGDILVENGSMINASNYNGGGITNTVTGNITIETNGFLLLNNTSTGPTDNTVNGTVTIASGGALYMANPGGTGTMSSTVDTINLGAGKFVVGGGSTTTAITTLNWSAGELDFGYSDGSFGTTTIDTLNLTGPVTLGLKDSSDVYLTAPVSGEMSLFSTTNFNGDANNITLINASPFVEAFVTPTAPYGIEVLGDGTVQVNLTRVASTAESTTLSALTGALDNTLMSVVQNSEIQDLQNFRAGSRKSAPSKARLQKNFGKSSKDPFEAFVAAFTDSNVPVFNFGGDRTWLSPYAVRVRNHGVGNSSAFTEKSYGLLLGSNYFLEGLDMRLTPLVGIGGSSTRYDLKAHSHNRARSIILGLVASKKFLDTKIDMLSSLYAVGSTNSQSRQGNPSPSQSYIASAHYETGTLSWQNELGYMLELGEGFALRPHAGIQVLGSYRAAFSEEDAGSFGQSYHSQMKYFGEGYAGAGLLKKWASRRYEGKMTLAYELGRQAGSQNSTVMVYTDTTPLGVGITNAKPGLTVQYVNLSGAVLDKMYNFRVAPGASYTYQKGQYSLAGSLKVEYQW